MSYTPIGWQTGDTITAEKMNKMDNGWSVSSTQLFSEGVTTTGSGVYRATLAYVATAEPPQTLIINFDGTDYTCQNQGDYMYGSTAEDFSDGIPFAIAFGEGATTLYTETAGTHTISAGAVSVETSNDFSVAVNNCVDSSMIPLLCVDGVTTYDEAQTASNNGRMLYFKLYDDTFIIVGLSQYEDLSFIPTSSAFTASFGGGTFSIAYN